MAQEDATRLRAAGRRAGSADAGKEPPRYPGHESVYKTMTLARLIDDDARIADATNSPRRCNCS